MPADVRPPYDPDLAAALFLLKEQMPSTVTPDMIELMRAAPISGPIEKLLEGRDVSHREVTVPGYQGDDIVLSIFARDDHRGTGPGIYHIHGGGMIIGDRFTGAQMALDWVEQFDAVCVSVEYRLAPEFPDPYLIEDCYAGLIWTADHARRARYRRRPTDHRRWQRGRRARGRNGPARARPAGTAAVGPSPYLPDA